MKIKDTIINLPLNLKIIAWKKLNCEKINLNSINIFIYNKSKKFDFFINTEKSNIQIDKWSNSIILNKKKINTNIIKFNNYFYNFIKSWDTYFFSKIKFKGKGFRIRFFKKIKLVKFFFGKSHKTFIFFKKIKTKRINKYKFIIKSLIKDKVSFNRNLIVNIRPLNKYTLRGLRSSKQIVFKRKGKKGTYI